MPVGNTVARMVFSLFLFSSLIFTWSFLNHNQHTCELILHCDSLRGHYGTWYHLTIFQQGIGAELDFLEEIYTAK